MFEELKEKAGKKELYFDGEPCCKCGSTETIAQIVPYCVKCAEIAVKEALESVLRLIKT